VDVKTQRTRRLESESSVTGYNNDGAEERERRDSTTAGDSTDEEALDHTPEQGKSKGKRRFSLDFLFSRRKSKDKGTKKEKSKRSQSTVDAIDDSHAESFRAYRYPGFAGPEFALAI